MPTIVPHQNVKIPASDLLGSCASYINTCYGIAGAPMLTAVQAATTIATLRSGIEGLVGVSVHQKERGFFYGLSAILQTMSNLGVMSSAEIVALTTINTVDADTDLLYLTAKKYDSQYDKNYYGRNNTFVTQP